MIERLPKLPARKVYASLFNSVMKSQYVFLRWANAAEGAVQYLEGIRSGENCHEWHVSDCDARAKHPYFEVQAAEPVPLHRARLDDEQPKAKLYQTRTRAAPGVSTDNWSQRELRLYLRGE